METAKTTPRDEITKVTHKDRSLAPLCIATEEAIEVALDPRFQTLVGTIDKLPETSRNVQGKIRTGAEIVKAILDREAFLVEMDKLSEGEFWEFNKKGQLVMGDGCAEPAEETFGDPAARIADLDLHFYHDSLNYYQSRTAATRIIYRDENGDTQVLEGDDFDEEANGDIKLPGGDVILAASILMERGLPTFDRDGFQYGEYTRKNHGQFENRHRIWTESGKLKRNPVDPIGHNPDARIAEWYKGINSYMENAGYHHHDLGSRRVLRVNLKFES